MSTTSGADVVPLVSTSPRAHVERGRLLVSEERFAEAEQSFQRALLIDPRNVAAHNEIGSVQQRQGQLRKAMSSYQAALRHNRSSSSALRNLAQVLFQLAHSTKAVSLLQSLGERMRHSQALLSTTVGLAMRAGELRIAGEFAAELALLQRGSHWHRPLGGHVPSPLIPNPDNPLSAGKLAHDIAQLRYLRDLGLIGAEFTAAIANLEAAYARMLPLGDAAREVLSASDRLLLGQVYNRIVYHRDTPRLPGRALSPLWDRKRTEEMYLQHPLGLVVIDDFLSAEALQELRAYCLQSTMWFINRYMNGRLGAFFRDGFNCPLLIQIAEEIREGLPNIIGDKYPLEQLWAFKYAPVQPKMGAHADFAAINVNFWITSDDANLDNSTGGMIVYDVEAPLDWDHETYNRREATIERFLRENRARGITVPYRSNRVVIFNSDLFHATDALRFRQEYEHRRINVTMLYGRREAAPAAVPPRRG